MKLDVRELNDYECILCAVFNNALALKQASFTSNKVLRQKLACISDVATL